MFHQECKGLVWSTKADLAIVADHDTCTQMFKRFLDLSIRLYVDIDEYDIFMLIYSFLCLFTYRQTAWGGRLSSTTTMHALSIRGPLALELGISAEGRRAL